MAEFKLLGIKDVAKVLSFSENYTRNVVVKQNGFPEPRYAMQVDGGKAVRSKPRWISSDIEEWVNENYLTEAQWEEREQPKKKGRPRKAG